MIGYNVPDTGVEAEIDANVMLVSMIDLDGRFTYVNDAFVFTSGFVMSDLIGQPNNIVRHSDVPAAMFDDMWRTIRSLRPWIGVLKNRCANGDHYWVRASVTPMLEDGELVGYMSVQTKAARSEIAEADKLFEKVRLRKVSRGRFECGIWVRDDVLSRTWRRLSGSVQAQLNFGLSVFVLSAALGLYVSENLSAAFPAWQALLALALLGCALSAGFHYSITLPIRRLLDTANQLASGALSSRAHSNRNSEIGKIAQAIEQLTMNLMGVVSDVRREAVGIRDTTDQVAQGGLDLSRRTEQQAANLEETSGAMQQFAQSTSDNAYATAQASGIAVMMAKQARASGVAVQRIVDTMRELETGSRRIGDIIGVIDGIAFRTNILALNAAVEAARAGGEGRGFAVVAGEVRSLAQRSAAAAREIKTLIDESVQRVDVAVGTVNAAGTTIDQTVESVGKVSRLIEEISVATGAQATEIAQVTAAVRQLDEMTQKNATLVEESAAAAETLRYQATRLVEAVDAFKFSTSK